MKGLKNITAIRKDAYMAPGKQHTDNCERLPIWEYQTCGSRDTPCAGSFPGKRWGVRHYSGLLGPAGAEIRLLAASPLQQNNQTNDIVFILKLNSIKTYRRSRFPDSIRSRKVSFQSIPHGCNVVVRIRWMQTCRYPCTEISLRWSGPGRYYIASGSREKARKEEEERHLIKRKGVRKRGK